LIIVFISVFGIEGCKKGKNSNLLEPPTPLPSEFTDALGTRWTCDSAADKDKLQGNVSFSQQIQPSRQDILHMGLWLLKNGNSTLIKTHCINNSVKTPIEFQMTYDGTAIDPTAQYVISTAYFLKLDDNTYLQAYKPNGLIEVINNQLIKNIEILVYVNP
jgi:uncharacterized lipoprotein YbaY